MHTRAPVTFDDASPLSNARLASTGNCEAADRLFAYYAPRLMAKAEKALRGGYVGMNASDVVQTTLRRAYSALPSLDSKHERALNAWFDRILSNAVRDHRRRALALKRGNGAAPIGLDFLDAQVAVRDSSEVLEGLQESEIVGMVWAALDASDRRVVRLRMVENSSWAQIAEACRLPSPDAARKRLESIRKRLSKRFAADF